VGDDGAATVGVGDGRGPLDETDDDGRPGEDDGRSADVEDVHAASPRSAISARPRRTART
jgi:hypothetical protein